MWSYFICIQKYSWKLFKNRIYTHNRVRSICNNITMENYAIFINSGIYYLIVFECTQNGSLSHRSCNNVSNMIYVSESRAYMRKSIAATDVPHWLYCEHEIYSGGCRPSLIRKQQTHSHSTEIDSTPSNAPHIGRKLKRLSTRVRRPPATGQH